MTECGRLQRAGGRLSGAKPRLYADKLGALRRAFCSSILGVLKGGAEHPPSPKRDNKGPLGRGLCLVGYMAR